MNMGEELVDIQEEKPFFERSRGKKHSADSNRGRKHSADNRHTGKKPARKGKGFWKKQ